MQSGGCTAVINQSLAGIINSYQKITPKSRIFGADHGIEGILTGNIPDITDISDQSIKSIGSAPGSALGSTRRKLRQTDTKGIFELLDRHDIRIFHIIGGNDSAATSLTFQNEASSLGYDLTIVNVPKTIDNDLVETDHCPGYGSSARFVAQATLGAGRDALAMGISSPITIIEVMGRDAGWLAASATLYKRDNFDPPHYIGVPEIPLDEEEFLIQMEYAYREYGYAVAVLAENARGSNGVIGGQTEPWFTDDFGHAYYEGPSRHLAEQVSRRLGVRCRYEKPGTIQRSLIDSISQTDSDEAYKIGQEASLRAESGETGVIMSLKRKSGQIYECSSTTVPLENVAGNVRLIPDEFLTKELATVGNTTNEFKRYLEPLTGETVRIPEHLLRN